MSTSSDGEHLNDLPREDPATPNAVEMENLRGLLGGIIRKKEYTTTTMKASAAASTLFQHNDSAGGGGNATAAMDDEIANQMSNRRASTRRGYTEREVSDVSRIRAARVAAAAAEKDVKWSTAKNLLLESRNALHLPHVSADAWEDANNLFHYYNRIYFEAR